MSRNPTLPHGLIEPGLDALEKQMIAALHAAYEAGRAGRAFETVRPDPPAPKPADDLIEVHAAAKRWRRRPCTIWGYCRKHNVGEIVCGKWMVSVSRMTAFMDQQTAARKARFEKLQRR